MWLLIAVLASLTIGNYWLTRSVLYPPFIFSAIWLLVVTVYRAGLIEIYPLHHSVLILVGAGAFSFSLGGEIARLIPGKILSYRLKVLGGGKVPPPDGLYLWKFLMLVVGFAGMLYIAHNIISSGLTGATGSILANAREAGLNSTAENTGIGGILSNYISLWANCTALMFLVERRDRWFWLMSLIALITAIATTARGPVLEIFVTLVTAHLIRTERISFKAAFRFARFPLLIFLSLYLLLTYTNKNTSSLEGGVLGVVVYFFVGYMIGPLAALDHVLQQPGEYAQDPNHTFKFLLKIGNSLHLWSYTPPPLFDQFIEVPFPTNVYTGYKFYYTDFGIVGCLIVVAIIGFGQTLLYRKALLKSPLALYMFCFLTFCLVMFIFDDLYSATGQIICVAIFGVLYLCGRRLTLMPRGFLWNVRLSLLPKKLKLTV